MGDDRLTKQKLQWTPQGKGKADEGRKAMSQRNLNENKLRREVANPPPRSFTLLQSAHVVDSTPRRSRRSPGY